MEIRSVRWGLGAALGCVLATGCAPRPRPRLPLLTLYNGDMEQGNDYPTPWGGDWVGFKRRTLGRDTQVRHSGKAALRLQLPAGEPTRTIEQSIEGGAGRALVLRGWLKVAGGLEVRIGVRVYGEGNQPLAQPAVLQVSHPTDWCVFTQPLTLPVETKRFTIALQARGQGSVWLDDVTLMGERVQTVPVDPATILPPQHQEPDRPYPGNGTTWHELHRALLQQTRRSHPTLVFIGDSITQNWLQQGLPEWERYLQPRGALNLGIGGDRTSQVLWRIRDGALEGLKPRVVVLAVGINNLIHDTHSPAGVVEGILTCKQAIERACPGTQVLVVGLLPYGETPTHPLRAKLQQVNAILTKRLDPAHFLNLETQFLSPEGTLTRTLFPDFIHPSERGYALYRTALLPKLSHLLTP